MRPGTKCSLLGGVVGAVLMFAAIWILEWKMNDFPSLDTQVIEYLEHRGCPVDSLGADMYRFEVEEDKFVFDYYPEDPAYLRIFALFDLSEFSRTAVETACFELMNDTKNIILVPEVRDEGMAVRIRCESFVSDEDALDTDIVDRSISLIRRVEAQLYHLLYDSAQKS